jgi:hypothetical protein
VERKLFQYIRKTILLAFIQYSCVLPSVIRIISLCDCRWYSLVWLYQQGWGEIIIPQAEKANTGVTDASARLLLTSYAFLYAKTFSGFGKIGNLIYRRRKLFLCPEECRTVFLLPRNLQPAQAYN